ncbi:diguanylate cyclase [Desulfosporosinus sp. PR]|uniref:HD domain-containing phosphohydrolase n=1 Tax=Candidatus Desulfosporosinus nitrosoreducens TaxID=3401928 RepID=UPI0027EABA49|nr:HD domain-containing phosphohydrolase [Desulfosporosinus sp. PR]MDQ7097030.1 diguanylate cyclase [Desulfosporosinus sp. PR]
MSVQANLDAVLSLLKLFTEDYSCKDYLQAVIRCISERTKCRCVGIRIRDDEGKIPYYATIGFDHEFLSLESDLSLEDECLCKRVFQQQFEMVDESILNEKCCICSNNLINFYKSLPEHRQSRFRGECVRKGLRTFAIIPLIHDENVIGTIQIADENPELLSPEMMDFILRISDLIVEGLRRYKLEEEVKLNQSSAAVLNAMFAGTKAIAYVVDSLSYRILFSSKTLQALYKKELKDQICYRTFYGLEAPCPDCQSQLNNRESMQRVHNRMLNRDYLMTKKSILWPDQRKAWLTFAWDITDQLLLERKYKTIFEASASALLILEKGLVISMVNQQAEHLLGFSGAMLVGTNLQWFLAPDEAEKMKDYYQRRINGDQEVPGQYETKLRLANGKTKYVIVNSALIPETTTTIISLSDITERKKAEDKLYYLSYHDNLTKLYNREYFDAKVQELDHKQVSDVGVIMVDVNGLNLINNSFGTSVGDTILKTLAEVLQGLFPHTATVARIGGDEFAVLLAPCSGEEIEAAYFAIRDTIEKRMLSLDIKFSAAVGYGYSGAGKTTLDVVREADFNMNRDKLFQAQSAKSSIVQTLTKALEARDFITEGHAERLENLAILLGRKVGLSEQKLSDLRLFAKFHDIGKVGIPDHILFKRARLEAFEKSVMETHCEIGYRIAKASPDLLPIADWILRHHENWDGDGYPLGLCGQNIPVECRILTVIDAYDAMTNDRPYRKAMPQAAVVEELKRCAGTQFDPEIVDIFLHKCLVT